MNLSKVNKANQSSLSQLSIDEFNNRPINLVPILIAHQLVLAPLYFFLPFWIFIFNSAVLILVYFGKVNKRFNLASSFKVLITIIAVVGVFISFHRISGRDAGVSLITIMYGLKILEIKSKRDVYILLLLGFFLLLAAFLFSSSPLMVIYQVIPVLAILYALQSIHTVNVFKQPNQIKSSASNSAFHHLFLSSSSRYLFKQLFKYLLLAMPIMTVLFLFFPRLSGPIWKMPGDTKASSGISETMSPGEISSLHLSEEIAFRAKFYGKEPQGREMYWRTLVLDSFDGLTWSHTNPFKSTEWIKEDNSPFQKYDINSTEAEQLDFNDVNENKYKYEIALEATQQNWLTFLDKPSRVISIAKVLNDFSVSTKRRLFSRIKYRAESQTNLLLNAPLTPQARRLNTRLPEGYNARSIQWAIEERKKHQSDQLFIQSLLKLINEKEFYYTLSPPIMQEDTVDSFWFDELKGFCEHYAGALAFMARAVGIPARVVIGYQGAEKNTLSDYWIVRHSNAHAWVEVWLDGQGWVRVDPTSAIAKQRIEEQLLVDYLQRDNLFDTFDFETIDVEDIGFGQQLSYWIDQMNAGWNDWFLEYNQMLQLKLISNLGLDQFSRVQIALFSLFAIIGFMLLINANIRFTTDKVDKLSTAFNLLNNKLSDYGMSISEFEGLNQVINRLNLKQQITNSKGVRLSERSIQTLVELLRYYQSIRYAKNICSPEEQKAFYNQVKKLKLTRSAN